MSGQTIYREVEVAVDISEFDTKALRAELALRDSGDGELPDRQFYEDLYLAVATNDSRKRDNLIRILIYRTIGRVVP